MNEDAVRTLLRRLAETPEPLASIDITRARRIGRRRRWLRRSVPPAATALAVAAALVAVPHGSIFGHYKERPAAAAPSQPASWRPPSEFNPLVPYASFGWLPAGFDVTDQSFGGPTSSPDGLSLGVDSPATHRVLLMNVNPEGACYSPRTASFPLTCPSENIVSSGPAPRVDGHPAVWTMYGFGIAWEYAPGAWASLNTAMTPFSGVVQDHATAEGKGWVPTPRSHLKRNRGANGVKARLTPGELYPPSATTRELLVKVASGVRFRDKKPLVFPFRLSGGLPAGWQLTSVTFLPAGGRLVGTSLAAGPASDPQALSVSFTAPDGYGCNYVPGQSSYVTRYGVHWMYRVIDLIDKHVQMLCSTSTVQGATAMISLDMNEVGSNASMPGSSQLGGAFGVYQRLHLLGRSPAAWTPTPLS
jgi:hypothetical protein